MFIFSDCQPVLTLSYQSIRGILEKGSKFAKIASRLMCDLFVKVRSKSRVATKTNCLAKRLDVLKRCSAATHIGCHFQELLPTSSPYPSTR